MSIEFVFRLIGMVVMSIGGGWFGISFSKLSGEDPLTRTVAFAMVGAIAGLVLTPYLTTRPMRAIRKTLTQVSAKTLVAGAVGLIVSLVVSALLAFPLSLLPDPLGGVLPVIVALAVCYLGVTIFVSRQNDVANIWSNFSQCGGDIRNPEQEPTRTILMDTSVIIDGRIADIAKTGFLPGTLIIPHFVLNELQYIADSAESLRRQRGRRCPVG